MTELKPCPFCGGTEIKMYSLGSPDLHGFSHLCKINGEAMVKVESRFFKTEEEAAEVWNRRTVNVPDTNVGDMIYRHAAIDAVERAKTAMSTDGEIYCAKINAQMNIQLLPSAQPVDKDIDVPSTDTISRQAAIDAICKACYGEGDYHKCDGYPETNTWCDELVALRALPSAQPDLSAYSDKLWRNAYERGKAEAQRWIPCSERLPEKSDDYLCTYGSLSGWFVDISIYETEKKEFGFYSENEHSEDVWHPVTNVVAWMPLPEPYNGGEQNE